MNQANKYRAAEPPQGGPSRQIFFQPGVGLCSYDLQTGQVAQYDTRQHAEQMGHTRHDSGVVPPDAAKTVRHAAHPRRSSATPGEVDQGSSHSLWMSQASTSSSPTSAAPGPEISRLSLRDPAASEAGHSPAYAGSGNNSRRAFRPQGRPSPRSSGPPRPGTLLQAGPWTRTPAELLELIGS